MAKKSAAPVVDDVEDLVEDIPKTIKVDSPEAWPEAADLKGEITIRTPAGELRFPARAIAYADWLSLTDTYAQPKPPKKENASGLMVEDREDQEYIDKILLTAVKRRVALVDGCCFKIQGDTIDAKVAWVAENLCRDGDLPKLFEALLEFAGFGLADLNRARKKPVVVASPEDWAKQTAQVSEFRVTHGKDTLVFHLRGISGAKSKAIEAMTQPPKPPMKAARAADRRIVGERPDPDDPEYKKQLLRIAEQRALLILEAALPFKIPGETPDAKLEWLGKRPAGEVTEIQNFVQYDVANLRERSDFILGL
ncbi:MAG: hypothetical protein KIS92_22445 [Planctomycetota bacterium]|nr:hypothetical protein [Planctomycetota bacterium]